MLTNDFELRGFLCPAEEADAELVFLREPLAEVDPGAISNAEDFATVGGTLAQGLGGGHDRGTVL